MTDTFHKLNEDKTQVVFIGTWQQLNKCKDYIGTGITIVVKGIKYSISVHNLSFYFDNNFKGS